MIFKQSILKEEKFKFLIGIICSSIPYIVLAVVGIIRQESIAAIVTLLMVFSPLFILIILLGLMYLEWFHIYEDRIEARYIFGVKNIVYFEKVSSIHQVKINLTTRGMEKEFYIFNDGRKNNNSYFDLNSCYNKKKFNLRIYKTPELENFINKKNLTVEIDK